MFPEYLKKVMESASKCPRKQIHLLDVMWYFINGNTSQTMFCHENSYTESPILILQHQHEKLREKLSCFYSFFDEVWGLGLIGVSNFHWLIVMKAAERTDIRKPDPQPRLLFIFVFVSCRQIYPCYQSCFHDIYLFLKGDSEQSNDLD